MNRIKSKAKRQRMLLEEKQEKTGLWMEQEKKVPIKEAPQAKELSTFEKVCSFLKQLFWMN